jgi:hypothetical protein
MTDTDTAGGAGPLAETLTQRVAREGAERLRAVNAEVEQIEEDAVVLRKRKGVLVLERAELVRLLGSTTKRTRAPGAGRKPGAGAALKAVVSAVPPAD